jgi:hypothetical protein
VLSEDARFCPLEEIPEAVTGHVRRCLGLDPETVPNAAWFRRRQSGEGGGRGCAERLDGAGQRGQDGGETGGEAGVMDAVPRDSRCGSGPIMLSYSPAACGVPGTPIGSDSMGR